MTIQGKTIQELAKDILRHNVGQGRTFESFLNATLDANSHQPANWQGEKYENHCHISDAREVLATLKKLSNRLPLTAPEKIEFEAALKVHDGEVKYLRNTMGNHYKAGEISQETINNLERNIPPLLQELAQEIGVTFSVGLGR